VRELHSSKTKIAVSEALMRRRPLRTGARGQPEDITIEQVFREICEFRIYDGPTEVQPRRSSGITSAAP
jgi:hypothetical protein